MIGPLRLSCGLFVWLCVKQVKERYWSLNPCLFSIYNHSVSDLPGYSSPLGYVGLIRSLTTASRDNKLISSSLFHFANFVVHLRSEIYTCKYHGAKMEISVSHLSRTVFNRKRCYNEIFCSHIFTIPDVFKDVWFLWLLGTSENNDKLKKGNRKKKTIDIKIINNYNFFHLS